MSEAIGSTYLMSKSRTSPGLRLLPMRVVPQQDQWPHTIVDYSFYGLNNESDRLACQESMQFGRALDHLLHKIWAVDHKEGPIYMLKVDLPYGFY